MRALSEQEKAEIWRLIMTGVAVRTISVQLGRSRPGIRRYLASTGGVRPRVRYRAANRLSFQEREEIFRGLAGGESLRCIARRLGRAPSTVSREVAGGGGRGWYLPSQADAGGVGPGAPAEGVQVGE